MNDEIYPVLPDWHDGSPAADAVMRGAAWLDEHYPGWAASAEGADCNSATRDIICRVTRKCNYTDARVWMAIDEDRARELGFDIFESDNGYLITNLDMQPHWDAAIAERLNHTMPENTMKPENIQDHPFMIEPNGDVLYNGDRYERTSVEALIRELKGRLDYDRQAVGHYLGYEVILRGGTYKHVQIGCQAFNIECIEAFIKDYENREKGDRVMLGDRVVHPEGDEYIVAKTGTATVRQLCLVNIDTGNIWSDPITVDSYTQSVPISEFGGNNYTRLKRKE